MLVICDSPLHLLWACRPAAQAWEAKFIRLAQTNLTNLATEAHLRLAFSSERSVEDELARETASDSVTVAASYLVMLVYIALALGTLPAGAGPWGLLVYRYMPMPSHFFLVVLYAQYVSFANGHCLLRHWQHSNLQQYLGLFNCLAVTCCCHSLLPLTSNQIGSAQSDCGQFSHCSHR